VGLIGQTKAAAHEPEQADLSGPWEVVGRRVGKVKRSSMRTTRPKDARSMSVAMYRGWSSLVDKTIDLVS
jgi:hypothetical protein